MAKKKLCFIIPVHWAAFMGGAQYQAKCILDNLSKSGDYEITYLARRVSDEFESDDYDVIKVADSSGIRRFGYFFDTLELLKLLNKIKPDIIYQRIACGHTGISAYYAKKNNCRMIWHVAHDLDVSPFDRKLSLNYIFRLIEKKFVEYGLKNADGIITQTKYQEELLYKNYNKKVAAVIPNFHPEPQNVIAKTEPTKVLWVANFKLVKHPEIFVRLARDLHDISGVKFQMIGSCGATNQSYSGIIKEIDELDNLEYLGGKTQDEVNDYMSQAHIFVNTSDSEGFANTFIQAWMRGVPVISLTVNPDDILETHKVGFYSGTYEKLLADVKRLVNDAQLRNTMGENAKRYAHENHSEKNVQRLVKVLEGK